MFTVIEKESGMFLDWFATFEKALKEVERLEMNDKKSGVYFPDTYGIVNTNEIKCNA